MVSFDFSTPIDYTPKVNVLKQMTAQSIQLQPVYLLQGNGDVLLLLTSLSDKQ